MRIKGLEIIALKAQTQADEQHGSGLREVKQIIVSVEKKQIDSIHKPSIIRSFHKKPHQKDFFSVGSVRYF